MWALCWIVFLTNWWRRSHDGRLRCFDSDNEPSDSQKIQMNSDNLPGSKHVLVDDLNEKKPMENIQPWAMSFINMSEKFPTLDEVEQTAIDEKWYDKRVITFWSFQNNIKTENGNKIPTRYKSHRFLPLINGYQRIDSNHIHGVVFGWIGGQANALFIDTQNSKFTRLTECFMKEFYSTEIPPVAVQLNSKRELISIPNEETYQHHKKNMLLSLPLQKRIQLFAFYLIIDIEQNWLSTKIKSKCISPIIHLNQHA